MKTLQSLNLWYPSYCHCNKLQCQSPKNGIVTTYKQSLWKKILPNFTEGTWQVMRNGMKIVHVWTSVFAFVFYSSFGLQKPYCSMSNTSLGKMFQMLCLRSQNLAQLKSVTYMSNRFSHCSTFFFFLFSFSVIHHGSCRESSFNLKYQKEHL